MSEKTSPRAPRREPRNDRLASYRLGFLKGSPILLGLAPFAIVYGAAANDAGLSLARTSSMSLAIFAGSAQLVFLNLWENGVGFLALVLAVAAVNLRLLIYGSSISPFLGPAPSTLPGLVRSYFLIDESYSVSMAHFLAGGKCPNRVWFYLGAAGPVWFGWQTMGIAGYFAGSVLPRTLPFEMAIPMVFLALLASVFKAGSGKTTAKLAAVFASGLSAALLEPPLPPGTGIIAGVFAGVLAGIAVLRFGGSGDRGGNPGGQN
ncbi:MAG: AzlC family ABC transporter permease [Deltaproteobacteria bacterium]|jgi:predicted branched-subunit amino acid permease|nr:AzlC family ABC transporter permease [Deltaproteobacteria bacterium]